MTTKNISLPSIILIFASSKGFKNPHFHRR
jgi:hypothetical protein